MEHLRPGPALRMGASLAYDHTVARGAALTGLRFLAAAGGDRRP